MSAQNPKTPTAKTHNTKMGLGTAGLPKTRLYVDAPLTANARLTLANGQVNYLVNVMRIQTDEALLVFNGRDGEWEARVAHARRQTCMLDIIGQVRPQRAEPGPWLAFAPIKKTAVDFLVEKATELGVSRLWPVFTLHTAATRVNLDRLRAHAIEASEQCERLTVPGIENPLPLSELMQQWPPERPLLVLDARGGGAPIADIAAILQADVLAGRRPDQPPGILTGPEGGLAAPELDALDQVPFVRRVTLGPRILKAETAALAGLACWQALAGDWRDPPPPRDARWHP